MDFRAQKSIITLFVFLGSWTHVKEIPNTKLLASLNQHISMSANIAIFDLSRESKPRRIYLFEEVRSGNED